MSRFQEAMLERYNYYNDSRTRESMRSRAYTLEADGPDFCVLTPNPILTEEDDPDVEPLAVAYRVRTSFQVCDMCQGSGKTVNPSIDAGGITQAQFDEDPGFRRDYFSGMYDQKCPECKGKRVTPDPAEVFKFLPPGVAKRLRDFQDDCDDDIDMRLAELRMGC